MSLQDCVTLLALSGFFFGLGFLVGFASMLH